MYYRNNREHTNTLCTRCRVFSVKTIGTYSNDCVMSGNVNNTGIKKGSIMK